MDEFVKKKHLVGKKRKTKARIGPLGNKSRINDARNELGRRYCEVPGSQKKKKSSADT